MSHFQALTFSISFGLILLIAELHVYRIISRRAAWNEWAAYHRWCKGQR